MADLSARVALTAALADLARGLEALPAPGAILGGLAAIAHGVQRLTRDIDATVRGDAVTVDRALADLSRFHFEPRVAGARELARKRHVLLLRHVPTGTEVDLSFAWLPFEHEALAAASPHEFAGVSVPVVSVTDLIIYKAVAWRPIDLQDIESLLVLHGDQIDLQRVRSWVRQFSEVLEAPGRVAEMETLIARAGS